MSVTTQERTAVNAEFGRNYVDDIVCLFMSADNVIPARFAVSELRALLIWWGVKLP